MTDEDAYHRARLLANQLVKDIREKVAFRFETPVIAWLEVRDLIAEAIMKGWRKEL